MISTFIPKIPDDAIRVSFYDNDGVRVDNVTKEQAKIIDNASPGKLFYFQDKDGLQRELTIDQVLQLTPQNDLISPTAINQSSCSTAPQPCGPPKVQFFGGEGVGAMANAVISPITTGVIGFDIVNSGKEYNNSPIVFLDDECGKGSGSSLVAIMEETEDSDPDRNNQKKNKKKKYKVKNIYIKSPGDGYLTTYDGSLGGNGRTWKEEDEGYVETKDGKYYTVPDDRQPINLNPGDIWNPPYSAPVLVPDDFQSGDSLVTTPQIISTDGITQPKSSTNTLSVTYKVLVCLDDIVIEDSGFNYRQGDQIKITPDIGSQLEPVINDRGEVIEVKIISKACGYQELPEIVVDSATGFNAILRPVLSVTPILDEEELLKLPTNVPLISVVDCVGKIPPKTTFDRIPR